jgi:hypothetical protein
MHLNTHQSSTQTSNRFPCFSTPNKFHQLSNHVFFVLFVAKGEVEGGHLNPGERYRASRSRMCLYPTKFHPEHHPPKSAHSVSNQFPSRKPPTPSLSAGFFVVKGEAMDISIPGRGVALLDPSVLFPTKFHPIAVPLSKSQPMGLFLCGRWERNKPSHPGELHQALNFVAHADFPHLPARQCVFFFCFLWKEGREELGPSQSNPGAVHDANRLVCCVDGDREKCQRLSSWCVWFVCFLWKEGKRGMKPSRSTLAQCVIQSDLFVL